MRHTRYLCVKEKNMNAELLSVLVAVETTLVALVVFAAWRFVTNMVVVPPVRKAGPIAFAALIAASPHFACVATENLALIFAALNLALYHKLWYYQGWHRVGDVVAMAVFPAAIVMWARLILAIRLGTYYGRVDPV